MCYVKKIILTAQLPCAMLYTNAKMNLSVLLCIDGTEAGSRESRMENQSETDDHDMMKIGPLSARSGVSRSSIHHYLNLGLLPKPVTAGLNIHLYGPAPPDDS